MIPQSKLSQQLNHALLANLPRLVIDPNHPKTPIHMMKGDPTEFGYVMSELGFEIVRNQIQLSENHSYTVTQGSLLARQSIAKHFNNDQIIKADDIIITSGVNCGLYYLFLAICNEGDNIIVPEIGYPFFDQIGPAYGVDIRKYNLKPQENWEVDIDHLNQLLDKKTKYLFIINPSNPCGSVFSRQHIQDIITWAQSNRVLIIADEVYYGISFKEFCSFGKLAMDAPIITLSGLEKIFFVPGWCTSWIIFYDKNKYLNTIKEGLANMCQLYLHSNTFLMNSLPILFDQLGIDYASRSIKSIKKNHDFLVQGLKDIKGLNVIPAQGTFYLSILIDTNVLNFSNDIEFVQQILLEENVSAFPLSCQGSQKYQGIRLLTCIQEIKLADLVDRMYSFCERHLKSE